MDHDPKREPAPANHPWQILAIAFLFFLPGIVLLFVPGPIAILHQNTRYAPGATSVVSPDALRIFGAVALSFSAILVGFYFRLRGQIARGPSGPEKGRLFWRRFERE